MMCCKVRSVWCAKLSLLSIESAHFNFSFLIRFQKERKKERKKTRSLVQERKRERQTDKFLVDGKTINNSHKAAAIGFFFTDNMFRTLTLQVR